ncbi:MAG TPA: SCP2 sterol-binding domain-containing protein [Pseudonocardia sp.]|uniref:SCP2 sterol-binding domain-containing protein n=1 Tax=Pseudonocardia sp. TaxID=60912 RepID=UPI002D1AA098|nr:SCP2 sterol-binding domain-containing protein [Pseudonocardia sp.]HTF47520.1 SCP2 sterol-binding domain-containing protein [Pseudonocardia sp.]
MVERAAGAPIESTTRSVVGVLRCSLEHLASEVPESYRHLVAELDRLVVEVVVDGEVFTLRTGRGRVEVVDGRAAAAGASIATTRATVLDVLDAEVALAEAVESGRLDVRGSLDDVLRAHDTLTAYVHAAIRASSVPGLIDALRNTQDGVR